MNSIVFVTGSDGLLGSNLVRELLRRGYKVRAMVERARKPFTLDGLEIEKVYGEITSPTDLEELSKGCDYVIHAAALTDLWPTNGGRHFRINVDGTKNVIDAALKNGISKVIYVGSASSLGYGGPDNPGTEESPYKSFKYRLDYLDSKHTAHQVVMHAVKDKNLPAIIVCPTFMIGPYDVKPSSGALVLALAKRKLFILPPGGKNWVAVRDVAVAICNALEMGRIGETYILGGENLSYREAITRMEGAVRLKGHPRVALPSWILWALGAIGSCIALITRKPPVLSYQMARVACDCHYFSPAKAIRELKMPQTPIELAARELYDWFADNRYL